MAWRQCFTTIMALTWDFLETTQSILGKVGSHYYFVRRRYCDSVSANLGFYMSFQLLSIILSFLTARCACFKWFWTVHTKQLWTNTAGQTQNSNFFSMHCLRIDIIPEGTVFSYNDLWNVKLNYSWSWKLFKSWNVWRKGRQHCTTHCIQSSYQCRRRRLPHAG